MLTPFQIQLRTNAKQAVTALDTFLTTEGSLTEVHNLNSRAVESCSNARMVLSLLIDNLDAEA